MKYFKVNFEFNKDKFENIIWETSKEGKGYVCFVDLTSLSNAYKNDSFRNILNNSLVNSCDGSYIALMASKLHKANFKAYIGPDYFEKMVKKPVKQMMIGGDEEVFKLIIKRARLNNPNVDFKHIELPFKDVNNFDYSSISKEINDFSPRLIWVSLGSPKQEIFMSKLLPFIHKGILIGVGAAFNYYTGQVKEIPSWARKTNLIWLYRIFTEPKKQIKRFKQIIKVLPKIYFEEKTYINNANTQK